MYMNSLSPPSSALRQAVCPGLDIKKCSQGQVRYAVSGCTERQAGFRVCDATHTSPQNMVMPNVLLNTYLKSEQH